MCQRPQLAALARSRFRLAGQTLINRGYSSTFRQDEKKLKIGKRKECCQFRDRHNWADVPKRDTPDCGSSAPFSTLARFAVLTDRNRNLEPLKKELLQFALYSL